MHEDVSAALHTLYHGTDPQARKAADQYLQRLQRDGDASIALKLLGSPRLEDQFFAAQMLVSASQSPSKHIQQCGGVQIILESGAQRVQQERKVSAVALKLFDAFANIVLQNMAQRASGDPLDLWVVLDEYMAEMRYGPVGGAGGATSACWARAADLFGEKAPDKHCTK